MWKCENVYLHLKCSLENYAKQASENTEANISSGFTLTAVFILIFCSVIHSIFLTYFKSLKESFFGETNFLQLFIKT